MSPQLPNSISFVDAAQRTGNTEAVSADTEGTRSSTSSTPEFSREERIQLLGLAHDSIDAALNHRAISLEAPTLHLTQERGAFTTLHLRTSHGTESTLRGCVGYVLPSCSVYRAVAETARAAAFDDNRFSPVTEEEAPSLEIEISILSPPQPIAPEEVEVGRHGLLISWHGHRGLLLPQVSIEHGWDRITFLQQASRKAGLPLNAWQQGAAIEAFTAEIFGDKTSGK